MKIEKRGIAAVLISTLCFLLAPGSRILAQNADLIYLERVSTNDVGGPAVRQHGRSGQLYYAVSRLGLFALDSSTLKPTPIRYITDGKVYEGNDFSMCSTGDILYFQQGFQGKDLHRIDSQSVRRIDFSPNVLKEVRFRGNGTVVCEVTDTLGGYKQFASVDCGVTWFAQSGFPILDAANGLVFEQQNPTRYTIARSWLGNTTYPSSMKSGNNRASFAFLGKDSIVWISRGRTFTTPDTIWYGDIRDSSRKRFDNRIVIDGVQDEVNLKEVKLYSSHFGTLFLFSLQGWYARYRNGSWRIVDTLPRIEGPILGNGNVDFGSNELRYIDKRGSQLVTVSLDSITDGHIIERVDPLQHVLTVRWLSSQKSALYYQRMTMPVCLHTRGNQAQVLNSIMGDMETVQMSPILFGFTNSQGEPVVIPFSDCAVRVTPSGLGELKASNIRDEYFQNLGACGPFLQSDRGMRTPFVGSGEVLSPGQRLRRFSRDGKLIDTLRNQPATAVHRLKDSTVIIGNGSSIIAMRPDGTVDSVELASVVCNGSGTAGYIGSLVPATDGSLLAFVNGLHVLDQETLSSKPWRCGGLLRSSDDGKSWTFSELPIESPYFLGSIRTSSGALVVSATQVIRDTTKRDPRVQNGMIDETLNHKFNDAYVLRSTDNGVTWTKVFTQQSSPAFGLIGGNGVVTDEGALLLPTTDGTLKSTNGGLDWELNTVTGMADGVRIISMFQDAPGSTIYFCTTTGLYKQSPATSVRDNDQSAARRIRAARTWEGHRSAWQQNRQTVRRLVSALGETLSPSHQPPAGLYMAEVSDGSVTIMQPILVVEE